jgi:hypothetical protein
VGFSTPINPAATRLDVGWGLNGGVGITNNYVGVLFDATFAGFGINRDALLLRGARNGGQKYWALTVDPMFHVNERGPVDFYVIGGGGLYGQITNFRASADAFGQSAQRFDLSYSNQILKPGVNGGAGFAFRIGDYYNLKIFAEARFHHMFVGPSGVSFIPVTIGVRF